MITGISFNERNEDYVVELLNGSDMNVTFIPMVLLKLSKKFLEKLPDDQRMLVNNF